MNLNVDCFGNYVTSDGRYDYELLKKNPKKFAKFFLTLSKGLTPPLDEFILSSVFDNLLALRTENKIKPSMFIRTACVMPKWINANLDEFKNTLAKFEHKFLTTPFSRFHENAIKTCEILKQYRLPFSCLKEAEVVCNEDGAIVKCPQIFLAANSLFLKNALVLNNGKIALNYGDGTNDTINEEISIAIINYCMKGTIEDDLTIDEYIELLKAADYLQLEKLKDKCLSIIERIFGDRQIPKKSIIKLYDLCCHSEHHDLAENCLAILMNDSEGISGFRFYGENKLEIGIDGQNIDLELFEFLRSRTQSLVFNSEEAIENFIQLSLLNEKRWDDVEKLDFADIKKELNGEHLKGLYLFFPSVKIINCSHIHFNSLQHESLKELEIVVTDGIEDTSTDSIEFFSTEHFEHFNYLVILRRDHDKAGYSIIDCKIPENYITLKDADDTLLQVLASSKRKRLEISSTKITPDGVKNYLIHKPKKYKTITFSDSPAICNVHLIENHKYFPGLDSLKELQFNNLANITDDGFIPFIKTVQVQQESATLTSISLSNNPKLTAKSIRCLGRPLLGNGRFLDNLRELTLQGFADLQDNDLIPLISGKKLEKFDIQGCSALTGSIFEELMSSVGTLKKINLSGCSFNSESLHEFLSLCTNLKEVKLAGCRVNEDLVKKILQKNPSIARKREREKEESQPELNLSDLVGIRENDESEGDEKEPRTKKSKCNEKTISEE